jgi:hypothetical protein
VGGFHHGDTEVHREISWEPSVNLCDLKEGAGTLRLEAKPEAFAYFADALLGALDVA